MERKTEERRPAVPQDIPSLLLTCLDDLEMSDLERFNFHLNHGPPPGYNPIPKSRLEELKSMKSVNEMLEYYGREGAVKVTLYILEKADLNEQAKSLRTEMDSMDSQPQPPPAVIQHDPTLRAVQETLKAKLRQKYEQLRELDLRSNDLLDSGVTALSAGLEVPLCKLQKLGLSGCGVTERGCHPLASALQSNPSHLIELDLSYNHPGDLGVKALSARLEDPGCTLEKLSLDHDGEWRIKSGMHKYGCHLTLDPNTAAPNVVLSEGNRNAVREKRDGDRQYTPPVLCKEALTDRHYWEVEWGPGSLDVGVTYQIPIGLGEDDQSWAITSDPQVIMAIHNINKKENKAITLMKHKPQLKYRVGVYLDWPTGILAFYKISSKGPIHLHTFHATFTKPLYPAFALSMNVPMTLC
ncbi:hypothetical protein SKAU_G00393120 [Synaphobranchus kaupii]|uniref:Pyrin n=1 Tax=Synaphobranchus kaupii TaxID=118154 RepID=A0A9Q1IDT5_SYNKA|nr:hypothetical protein SKAU_G00393120 [Synaphobranchus kaupii]